MIRTHVKLHPNREYQRRYPLLNSVALIPSIQRAGYIYIILKELQVLQVVFSLINKRDTEYVFHGFKLKQGLKSCPLAGKKISSM